MDPAAKDQDGAMAGELPPTWSRRRILTTARGVALAMSGGPVPAWLLEGTAAANPPAGTVPLLDGPTSPKQRQRSRGFCVFDCDPLRARWGYYSEAGELAVEFRHYAWSPDHGKYWWDGVLSYVPAEDFRIYKGNSSTKASLTVSLRFHNTQHYFLGAWANKLTMGYDGRFDKERGWEDGVTIVDQQALNPSDFREMRVDGLSFLVERLADEDIYYRWSATVRRV